MTSPAIKTHESDEFARGLGQGLCGICQRNTSRYTCPSCNLFHCSLNCFRSESHSHCSENFYRREIEIGIRFKSESSKSEGDRNNIFELLMRIEEHSADEGVLSQDSDGESEEDSLTHRFSAIDISSASADDLLRLLTKKERDKFFYALRDPSSAPAQELLKSAELEKTTQLPWWEASSDGSESPLSLPIPYGQKPDIMIIPADLINQASRGVSLLYNISAVLLAYAYITRHLAISPLSTTSDIQDRRTARSILLQSVPFFADRRSRLLYPSLADAVLSFWSRLDSRSIDNTTILVLLQDVATLARPQRITETGGSSGEEGPSQDLVAHHPSVMTVMVISDLSSLFSTHLDSAAVVRRRGHIEMKLTFYAAHILSTPSSHMHALADEVLLLSRNLGEKAIVGLEQLAGSR